MRYWLQLMSADGFPLEPVSEWVCETLDDPAIPDKCCALLRSPAIDAVLIYDQPPTDDLMPVQIHRKNPCKKH